MPTVTTADTRRRFATALRTIASRVEPTPEPLPAPEPEPAGAPEEAPSARVLAETQRIGDDWRQQDYYEDVERFMDSSWETSIAPFLEGSDFSVVVDLAAGHGRNTRKLLEVAGRVIVTDINIGNIEICRRRFAGEPRVECFVGDGLTLKEIPDASVTLVYCFDAMVHFDSDTVRSYLRDIHRVLVPGGRAFCHHSNYTANPGGDVHDNPQWRNFMSQELFAHYARNEGFEVVRSTVVDWGPDPELDCYTLIERP